ncbi:MAG: exosortase H [Parahaliea sp.]
MNRFTLIFLLVLVGLFTLELLEPVQQYIVQPFTSGLAALSVALITPFDAQVVSYGRVIEDSVSHFAISIEAGCNGIEAAIVLIAAILAFPASARDRLLAIVIGFATIQLLNIGRIITLFYLGQWNEAVFSFTHLYLWPVLIMLDVLVVFLVYLRYLGRKDKAVPA